MKVKECRLLARRRQLNTHVIESDAFPLSDDELERIWKSENPNFTMYNQILW